MRVLSRFRRLGRRSARGASQVAQWAARATPRAAPLKAADYLAMHTRSGSRVPIPLGEISDLVKESLETVRKVGRPHVMNQDVRAEWDHACNVLELADDVLHGDGLEFGPLALLWWGLSVTGILGAAYTVAKVAPLVAESSRGVVQTASSALSLSLWAALGLGLYMIAKRARRSA